MVASGSLTCICLTSKICGSKNGQILVYFATLMLQSKVVIRNKCDQFDSLLHKDKEHLALRNNFRVTKKFFIAKFDCIIFRKMAALATKPRKKLGGHPFKYGIGSMLLNFTVLVGTGAFSVIRLLTLLVSVCLLTNVYYGLCILNIFAEVCLFS